MSLKQRGSLDFWLDSSIFSNWRYSGKQSRGGKVQYSDVAIKLMLTLSYVYKLPLRQTEGFMLSILSLHNQCSLKIPDYTTLCRRRKTLDVSKKLRKWNRKENIVFAIDGSGLKCCGEKEWMRKKHKTTRRRKFIKIHTAINVNTRHIVFNKATSSRIHDGTVLPKAIDNVGKNIKTLLADGGYDFKSSYKAAPPHVKVIIPPRSNAVKDNKTKQRNEAIDYIKDNGKSRWKKDTGYHQRSIVENTFSRWKTIFGENVTTKSSQSQQTEIILKSVILNKMTDIGMPQWKKMALD
jgi:IS5 family transposase